MRHTEGKFTTTDGLEIYHQAWAADGAPKANLLIVHGLGEHSGRYQNYVDYFVPRGYTLYGFDLRGHGRSGGPRGHADRFERLVDDVGRMVSMIRAQAPDAKLFLLGHSLGSLIVLAYGLEHPAGLSGIITTGTAFRDALEVPAWKRGLGRVLNSVAPALKFENGINIHYLSHDPAAVAAYEHDPLVHPWGTPRLATEVNLTRARLLRRAGEWKLPLLMLHGGTDRICLPDGARAFQAATPASLSRYHEFPGLYHEIHNEFEKEVVFGEIESWLADKI